MAQEAGETPAPQGREPQNNVVETHGLTHYYGARKSVDSLDLAIPRGSIFALLGRNGSGKTTTIRLLLGLLEPARGRSSVLGHDSANLPPQVLGRIGYMNEEHRVYGWMRVEQLERFQASFYPQWNHKVYAAVIDHFHLDPRRKVRHLSRGERAGLCLALTLAPEPKFLILDDPGLGLDTVVRRSLMEAMVYVTRDSRRTILFSSHILTDVERVADRIAILDRGVLRADCPLDTFRERVRRVSLRFDRPLGSPSERPSDRSSDDPRVRPPDSVCDIPGLLQSAVADDRLTLTIANYTGDTEQRLRALSPREMQDVPLSLEEAFVSYVQGPAQGAQLLSRL
jgi:ABC-2 type transport system ATP-binding protein